MSDDEVDHELLDLLRQKFGIGPKDPSLPPETDVLQHAEYIYNNSVDVALDMRHTKLAALSIAKQMQARHYGTATWADHALHPKSRDETTVNFIFTMDLLNFSFWSEGAVGKKEEAGFCVEWEGKTWTGYWSLVAVLQRALAEGIPITTPGFWTDEVECSVEVLRGVFRSETEVEIPMFEERVRCLREAGRILDEDFDSSVITLIEDANKSAAGLVNLLAKHFPCFNDEAKFERKKVRFLKRAQIFVADLWAAFDGQDYGEFNDIDKITMFADYRVPQMLHSLGVLQYSPPLEGRIRRHETIPPGHTYELQIRGCSIWAIELLLREIHKLPPAPSTFKKPNAILLDFFLYDLAKEREEAGVEAIPHHRTRSIWY